MKTVFVIIILGYIVVCFFSFIALLIQLLGYVGKYQDYYFSRFMVHFKKEKHLNEGFAKENKSRPIFNYQSGIFRLLFLILLVLTDILYYQVNGESMIQWFYNSFSQ